MTKPGTPPTPSATPPARGGGYPAPARRSRTKPPTAPRHGADDRHPPDDPPAPAARPAPPDGSGSTDRSGQADSEPPDRSGLEPDTGTDWHRGRLRAALRIDDPGELAAAVPVLLGFHPSDSLVLMAIGGPGGGRIGLTVRVDLPRSGTADDLREVCESAVSGLLTDEPRGAAVLVFAEGTGAQLRHRRLVDAVARRLRERGVQVHALLWVESSAAGARWACYGSCRCAGRLPDPATTALAAASVVEGRVVRPSRAALQRLVAPGDAGRLRRREALLIAAGAAGPVLDTAVLEPAAALETVDAALADAGEGRLVLDDGRVVALALALAEPTVRDEAMHRCVGRTAAAAEQLWSALVRETPDPEAAEPAALLAVSALLRGDGALANVALDRAEAAWPGHRLSTALRSAIAAGMRPVDLRRLLRDSLDTGPAGAAVRRAGGSARRSRRRRPSR
jgi:hypothetical protein